MPSMPLRFWNDPDDARYREAYFMMYPDVWRHGDWITITDTGGVIIQGRSDSTLNRHGIRMGSADIYDAVEQLPEIQESLVLGVEDTDGGYWIPLFVVLTPGSRLDDDLRRRIGDTPHRATSPTTSSRHPGCHTPVPAGNSRSRSNGSCKAQRQPSWTELASMHPNSSTGTSRSLQNDRRPNCLSTRSEEHTSELQSPLNLVCRLLLEK